MRPLPRLFAFTDAKVRKHPHCSSIAAALASVGPAVGVVARDYEATGAELTDFAARLLTICRPYEATTFVAGRPDIAAGLGAHGLHLRRIDLSPSEARTMMPHAWIGCSVHTAVDGAEAVEQGADFLVAGNIYEVPSHPGRTPAGLGLLETLVSLGRPVIAIGGVTAQNVWDLKHAGAYGVGAIRALWEAPKPGRAALEMLEPWM